MHQTNPIIAFSITHIARAEPEPQQANLDEFHAQRGRYFREELVTMILQYLAARLKGNLVTINRPALSR